MRVDSTRVSSKGQVVIPAWIRRKLDLSPGESLTVEVGEEGKRTIILRGHSKSEVERFLEKGYEWIERTRVNLVEDLHEARRKERLRGRRRRSP